MSRDGAGFTETIRFSGLTVLDPILLNAARDVPFNPPHARRAGHIATRDPSQLDLF